MLSRRIVAARPLTRALVPTARRRPHFTQIRTAATDSEPDKAFDEANDPDMNGGYISPPYVKRGMRDPYGDYWDKQERRNYGEPLHEDEDIMGRLATEEYTHFKPGWGGVLFGTFVASVFALCGAISFVYPDKISAPRTFEGGLYEELGGKGAL
ncbi:hypothetical protein P154DRAFT_391281, partial [Amniculicola lignicola CBS 123094]